MTLIEILIVYIDLIRREGRAKADAFLSDCTEEVVAKAVSDTVTDSGSFIMYDGDKVVLVKPENIAEHFSEAG